MTTTATQTRHTAPRHQGCQHFPACPTADAPDHDAARVVASHPEQGWSLLCNGVVVFEDTGEILPNRTTIAPHRPGTSRRLPLAA
jgi:Family of unknown function (DUF5999)